MFESSQVSCPLPAMPTDTVPEPNAFCDSNVMLAPLKLLPTLVVNAAPVMLTGAAVTAIGVAPAGPSWIGWLAAAFVRVPGSTLIDTFWLMRFIVSTLAGSTPDVAQPVGTGNATVEAEETTAKQPFASVLIVLSLVVGTTPLYPVMAWTCTVT